MEPSGPLRILLISHGLPPTDIGGVEQHVDGLARALHAAGHRVTVYAKTGDQTLPQGHRVTSRDEPFEVTRVVYRYEGLTRLHDLYARTELDHSFADFLKDRQFDVAHVHHLTGLSTGILHVLRTHGIKVVLTLHDYWLICPRGQMWRSDGTACETVEPVRCAACLQPTFGGWLPAGHEHRVVQDLHDHARTVLQQADRLVVPSARAIPPFVALGIPRERFTVLENGVDVLHLNKVRDVKPLLPLRLGYLGTLIPSKGLEVLVRAVQQLPAGAVTLSIHGNTVPYHGDANYLTSVFARLRPTDKISYHGPYGLTELPGLLSGIDVLVAPALWHEAYGLTVREALAAGRPVVVSRIGGLQDAVEDGVQGFVVPPGDVLALAAALHRFVLDPALVERMGAAARKTGRGMQQMAADALALYQDLCAGRV